MGCTTFVVFVFLAWSAIDGTSGTSRHHNGCSNERWFRLFDRVIDCGKHQHKHSIAFMARFSGSVKGTNRKHETLVFNNVITNMGKAYSGATGVFVCPVYGAYSFSWSILNYQNQVVYTELVVNGTVIMGNHAFSGLHKTITANAVVQLKRGDKVWIRRHGSGSTSIHGGIWSSFQGFKI